MDGGHCDRGRDVGTATEAVITYPGEWWVGFALVIHMLLLVGLTVLWARKNW